MTAPMSVYGPLMGDGAVGEGLDVLDRDREVLGGGEPR